MQTTMIIKPYRGRYVTRKNANRINDILELAKKPDRTALHKEAQEFEELMLKRRQTTSSIAK